MSFDDGQQSFDAINGHKIYLVEANDWKEVSAKHDGGDIDVGNIQLTNAQIMENNVSLQGENGSGTPRILVRVNTFNETEFSQAGITNMFLGASTEFSHNVAIESATPNIELKNTAETTSGLYIFDSISTGQFARVLFDASGDEMIINTSSLLTLQRAGFDRLTIDASTTKIAANNFEVTSGRTLLSRAAVNDVSLRVDATSSTFASAASQIRVPNRTNSTAYSFLVCDNSSGRAANLRGNGDLLLDGSVSSPAADMGEMMEWHDGNPNNEDRVGMTVTFVPNDKGKPFIKIAEPSDNTPPIGVVRADGQSSVVGNTDWAGWQGRWRKDEHGRIVTEAIDMIGWVESEVNEPDWHAPLQTRMAEIEASDDYLADDAAICEEIDNFAQEHRQLHADLRHWQHQLKRIEVMNSEEKTKEAGDRVDAISQRMAAIKAEIAVRQNQCDRTMVVRANHQRMLDSLTPSEAWPTKETEHCYKVGEVPDGVVVPIDANRWTEQVPVTNPAYDPLREHEPRADRKEWALIGCRGIVTINKGQKVGKDWLLWGDVSADVELYYI